MKFTVKSIEEQHKIEGILKEAGYTRTSNCLWVEVWNKENREEVVIERD